MKFPKILTLISLVCSMAVFTACDKDNNSDEPGYGEETPSTGNPMEGKTIKCVETYNGSDMRISTNFTITFRSATRYRQTLKQKAEEKDWMSGKWTISQSVDKEITGNYEYSSSTITLRPDDGGTSTLTKVSDGWKDGNYIYK